ncbi:methyltransferase family protein [Humitalea rosea]|uniref:Methyltransferase family protein n=1 Tax=Humitalea rosea TaxID=990373 RepID=A0A2W7JG09_9PROT|nr:class I SAM-dependent methyltransferase [Humitalea rosea]PZW51013.1 methyltransferase family protein [Humitalea rosea]
MTDWSHGYVADSPYTVSYQPSQTPSHLAMVCAMMGVAWEPRATMVVADIGCGRGFTTNALAAANAGWTLVGLDYNPAHVAEADAFARRVGLDNAIFVEADLSAMTDAEMDQIPLIDVAMLHGVWTWVSESVRAGIVRLLSRRLKPGGIAYFGYNALPGFGADMALQRLFRHLAPMQQRGTSAERAAGAIPTIRALHQAKAKHLAPTPMLLRLAEDETPVDSAYLAHEFMTAHWRPVFHEDLCADLAGAKLEYVGSCTLSHNIADLVFEPAQRAVYDTLPEGPAREFLKDLCLANPFRRDVFIRGRRPADPVAAMDRLSVALCRPAPEASPKLQTAVGVAELSPEMWAPIRAALLGGAQRIGDLRRLPEGRQPNPAELLTVLEGTGYVLPVLRQPETSEVTIRFNRVAAEVYAENGLAPGRFALASPAAAGGLNCTSLELAIAALPDIAEEPTAAEIALRLLPNIEGEALDNAIVVIAEILAERIPVWRRFGIL